jgi:hypothetical protein
MTQSLSNLRGIFPEWMTQSLEDGPLIIEDWQQDFEGLLATILFWLLFPKQGPRELRFQIALVSEAIVRTVLLNPDDLTIDLKLAAGAGFFAREHDDLFQEGLRRKLASKQQPGVLPGAFAAEMLLVPLVAQCQGKRLSRNDIYRLYGRTAHRTPS